MQVTSLPDASLTLLTGATGALGQDTLCRWLESRPQAQLAVLARGRGKGGAVKRVQTILRKHFSGEALEQIEQRVTVLDGDVSEPELGLDTRLYHELKERTSQVIHCAAAVRFDQPLEEARHANYEGTRQVLQLALDARARFDYVSTAYIAGKRHGIIHEQDYAHNKGFRNTYEQTKYEAEGLVRQAMQTIPVAIYRPSIIIGDSRTGETSNFKAFYWPIRVYALGQLKFLPAVASCKVDLVPVDYVSSALVYLSGQEQAIGQCYHLTAGRDNTPTVAQVRDAAINFFKIKPAPLTLHPAFLKLVEHYPGKMFMSERALKMLKLGEPYYAYFTTKLEYDNAQTVAALKPAGISVPHVQDFFDRLFRYCLETDWGRRNSGSSSETACELPENRRNSPENVGLLETV